MPAKVNRNDYVKEITARESERERERERKFYDLNCVNCCNNNYTENREMFANDTRVHYGTDKLSLIFNV